MDVNGGGAFILYTDQALLEARCEAAEKRVVELQQFHDWAEPQVHDNGVQLLRIEALEKERDELQHANEFNKSSANVAIDKMLCAVTKMLAIQKERDQLRLNIDLVVIQRDELRAKLEIAHIALADCRRAETKQAVELIASNVIGMK